MFIVNKTTVYLTDDQTVAYDSFAKQDARPKAEIIREALDAYAANRARRLPQAVGIFDDLGVDSANVDDWPRANWRPDTEIATGSHKAET